MKCKLKGCDKPTKRPTGTYCCREHSRKGSKFNRIVREEKE